MKYRKPVSRKGSKRLFTATAVKTSRRNVTAPSRGGVRL